MFASSGRAQLAYQSTGVLDGADVLLIHAGVNDRRSWQHVVERLSSRHRCVAFDARAFGETVYEREDGWSPVSDAVAVLDAAGLQRPVVVACSIGGQTAIDLTLASPDRVAGLVLIGTAIRGAPYPNLQEGPTAELNARIEEADSAGDIDEVARLEAWMWLAGPPALGGRVNGPARELFLHMNRRALAAEDPGEQAELPAAWTRLGEIAVPTLVMIGQLDAEEIQAIDEPAAGVIPGARLRLLGGVGHVPHPWLPSPARSARTHRPRRRSANPGASARRSLPRRRSDTSCAPPLTTAFTNTQNSRPLCVGHAALLLSAEWGCAPFFRTAAHICPVPTTGPDCAETAHLRTTAFAIWTASERPIPTATTRGRRAQPSTCWRHALFRPRRQRTKRETRSWLGLQSPHRSARPSRFADLSPGADGTRIAPGLCSQAFIEELLKAFVRPFCSLGVSIMRQVAAVDNLDPELIEVVPVPANRSSEARHVP